MPDEKQTAPEGEFGGPDARWLATSRILRHEAGQGADLEQVVA